MRPATARLASVVFNAVALVAWAAAPYPLALAARSAPLWRWWYLWRFEWNIDVASRAVRLLGLGRAHDSRLAWILDDLDVLR